MNDTKSQEGLQSNLSTEDPLPNGAAGAAILSAAIGCCVLGILAVIGDGSKAVANWLTFYLSTGPLSGVTIIAIAVWLTAWLIFARRWGAKAIAITKVNAVAFVLLAISLLLTFPPFANLLLGK